MATPTNTNRPKRNSADPYGVTPSRPSRNKDENKKDGPNVTGSGMAPKTRVYVGPDRRAQAVLRRANMPKDIINRRNYSLSTIKQPGVGVEIKKGTHNGNDLRRTGTESDLSFNRYKPGDTSLGWQGRTAYSTKATKKKEGSSSIGSSPTVQGKHKDDLRRAAIEHGLGRQMQDVRPGQKVGAQAVGNTTARGARNARGREYQRLTRGALDFERGHATDAESRKLTKTTWQPTQGPNTGNIVNFDPNSLKDRLKGMAASTIVRAGTRLIGGPVANAALTIDDSVAAATGKRPSKEIAKAHVAGQSKLVDEMQKKKRPSRAPWAAAPF